MERRKFSREFKLETGRENTAEQQRSDILLTGTTR